MFKSISYATVFIQYTYTEYIIPLPHQSKTDINWNKTSIKKANV